MFQANDASNYKSAYSGYWGRNKLIFYLIAFFIKLSRQTYCNPQLYFFIYFILFIRGDRLCGLVVIVLGYRSGGPGSIPSITRKTVVGLERGPLSLVSTTEMLLERQVATPV
jgi:hypothetical protein